MWLRTLPVFVTAHRYDGCSTSNTHGPWQLLEKAKKNHRVTAALTASCPNKSRHRFPDGGANITLLSISNIEKVKTTDSFESPYIPRLF